MSEPSDRPPVRARSSRRPIPALIVLLVLALVALGVWWNVLRADHAQNQAQAAACSYASAAPSLDPATVTVRVFNATATAGLATTVAAALKDRGFVVTEVGNDPHAEITVTGVGQLRFGARGAEAAHFVRLYVPGVTDRPDTRATAVVDVVLGPDFKEVASADQVAATLSPLASAAAVC